MTLANGIDYIAIPGPSVVPERVLRAMHRSSPNIYEGELASMVPSLVDGLKKIARTCHHVAMYVANGHGAWEAALANTLRVGNKVLILSNGIFADGWAEMAHCVGLDVEIFHSGKRDALDLEMMKKRLGEDDHAGIKAVLAVHTDTSTGICNDIQAIRDAIDVVRHPALFMVDCMASLGCDRFEMDAWGVDVMVSGSQKGLMMPPGMGFVFFNDKAATARDKLGSVSSYWDWRRRVKPEIFYHYFGGTAPTHHLFGLREVVTMIEDEGLDDVWNRHAVIAQAVWAAFDHWGQDGQISINAPIGLRSHSVTALHATDQNATELRDWCRETAGLTLGVGLGMAPIGSEDWHQHFRLGHMGHVNAQMILGALATIEAGFQAVGLKHSPGGVLKAAEIISDVQQSGNAMESELDNHG